LRQLETTDGTLKLAGLQDNPPMLLGRHMYENRNMDGTFDATATANNYLLLYGAFENLSSSTVQAARSSWCLTSWEATAGRPASGAPCCGFRRRSGC